MILAIATAGLLGAIVIRQLLASKREARVVLRVDPHPKARATRKQ